MLYPQTQSANYGGFMEQSNHNKLALSPIGRLIFTMSVPAIFSMLVQALYNIVDSAFVSRLGTDALTSVSLAFPLQMLIISVAVGTGIGVNSLISRRLGESNKKEADSAAVHGIFIALISSLPFIIFGLFFSKPFVAMFTQSQSIVNDGAAYLSIVMIFSFASLIQIMMEKTLQATGNMFWPMIFQLLGAVINIVLDPILIFGLFGFPAMGVKGAAIATVASIFIAMLFSLYVAVFKNHGVSFHFKGFKWNRKTISDIYAVGLPSIIMQSIGSLLTMGMNGILSTFSDAAVAVLGIYYKLQSFVFMPVFGLSSGIMPILGFNYGAKNKARFTSALKIGIVSAAVIMGLGTAAFTFFPQALLGIFKEAGTQSVSQELLNIGVPALKIISISFVPAAVSIISSTMLQASGYGKKSLVISVLRQLLLILPLAYIFSKISLNSVWLAYPIAEVIVFFVSLFISLSFYKKHISSL